MMSPPCHSLPSQQAPACPAAPDAVCQVIPARLFQRTCSTSCRAGLSITTNQTWCWSAWGASGSCTTLISPSQVPRVTSTCQPGRRGQGAFRTVQTVVRVGVTNHTVDQAAATRAGTNRMALSSAVSTYNPEAFPEHRGEGVLSAMALPHLFQRSQTTTTHYYSWETHRSAYL
eukprot:XP_014034713.1 PREDICTED: uncharacterized protein LOC106589363 isoform X2 [Salmo salar]